MPHPFQISSLFTHTDRSTGERWDEAPGRYPFALKVVVPRNLSPRDDMFGPHLDYAREFCARVFRGTGTFLNVEMLVLPERWLGPVEQIDFLDALAAHPAAAALRELRILTQSMSILLCCDDSSIRLYADETQETGTTPVNRPASASAIASYCPAQQRRPAISERV